MPSLRSWPATSQLPGLSHMRWHHGGPCFPRPEAAGKSTFMSLAPSRDLFISASSHWLAHASALGRAGGQGAIFSKSGCGPDRPFLWAILLALTEAHISPPVARSASQNLAEIQWVCHCPAGAAAAFPFTLTASAAWPGERSVRRVAHASQLGGARELSLNTCS